MYYLWEFMDGEWELVWTTRNPLRAKQVSCWFGWTMTGW